MKIALSEIQVWPFRSLSLLVGGGTLLAIAKLSGQSVRVPTSEIRPLLFCALFNMIGWHLFSGYGVSMIEAGRASVIAFTMPVWAALLGLFMLGEKLTRSKLLSLALGIAGLVVLIGGDLAHLDAAPLGAFLMLGAAISWAMGTVLMKRYSWSIPPGVLAGWQLVAGGVPITIGALLFSDYPNPADLSLPALAALAYVLAIPMVFCHWAWFKVVRLFPAALAAIGTLAIPIVGVFASAAMLDEAIGSRELIALALVCAALLAVLVLPALRTARKA